MKRYLAPLLFMTLIAASEPPAAIVQAVTGDWSQLPPLQQRGYEHLNMKVMVRLHEIASNGQCRLPGFYQEKLDLRLSFAAQFAPDGTLRKVLIPRLNCPEAEGIVGGALLEMVHGGDYRPTGKNPDGWYQGSFAFFEG
jgi:hypothetical protein